MKRSNFSKARVVFLLCLLIVAADCFCTEDCQMAEYERIVRLSEPLPAGSIFEAQTNNGHIDISGTNVNQCDLTATIIAKADTEENAKKLAEEVKVELISSDNKLTTKIEKPKFGQGRHVSISLDINVPKQTALKLLSNVGEIHISDITEPIEAKTNVGVITCKEITADTNLTTNIGAVEVVYSESAPGICNADIKTDIGKIDFTAPVEFSAKVKASTNIGSIQTNLPLSIKGKVNQSLSGTIGKGEGKIILKTNIGEINIK